MPKRQKALFKIETALRIRIAQRVAHHLRPRRAALEPAKIAMILRAVGGQVHARVSPPGTNHRIRLQTWRIRNSLALSLSHDACHGLRTHLLHQHEIGLLPRYA